MILDESFLKREKVQKFLRTIIDKNINEFKPSLKIDQGEVFPEVEEIIGGSSKEAKEILEGMAQRGFFLKEFSDIGLFCPKCNSHAFMIKLKCPLCKLSFLEKGTMIEHLKCGYIDFEEKFISRRGLFCPKCGKELKAIGIDYRKLETYYKCINCNTPISPIDYYICLNCFSSYMREDLVIKEIYNYIFNPEKKSLIESLIINLEPIVKHLNEIGLIAFSNINIEGSSGIKHNFDLVVHMEGDRQLFTPAIVLDVIIRENIVDEKEALAFYAKALDVNAKNKCCIAIPKFSNEAKTFLKNRNVYISEAKDVKILNDSILDLIHSIITEYNLNRKHLNILV